jgi:hypothetical protein
MDCSPVCDFHDYNISLLSNCMSERLSSFFSPATIAVVVRQGLQRGLRVKTVGTPRSFPSATLTDVSVQHIYSLLSFFYLTFPHIVMLRHWLRKAWGYMRRASRLLITPNYTASSLTTPLPFLPFLRSCFQLSLLLLSHLTRYSYTIPFATKYYQL